jgi:hypothetical protein
LIWFAVTVLVVSRGSPQKSLKGEETKNGYQRRASQEGRPRPCGSCDGRKAQPGPDQPLHSQADRHPHDSAAGADRGDGRQHDEDQQDRLRQPHSGPGVADRHRARWRHAGRSRQHGQREASDRGPARQAGPHGGDPELQGSDRGGPDPLRGAGGQHRARPGGHRPAGRRWWNAPDHHRPARGARCAGSRRACGHRRHRFRRCVPCPDWTATSSWSPPT